MSEKVSRDRIIEAVVLYFRHSVAEYKVLDVNTVKYDYREINY